MSSWTDELSEPLRGAGTQGRWCRIEEARAGGWILLSDAGAGDVDWWHLSESATELSPLDPLDDRRLPELRQSLTEALRRSDRIELLAWRVGSRAIFRLEGSEGARLVKVYRKDRQTIRRWQCLPSDSVPWRVPKVLDWDASRKRLEIEFCAGESLNSRWLAGHGDPSDGKRVGQLLSWLSKTTIPSNFPVHSIEDEIKILVERLPVFERVLANPPPRAAQLVDRVASSLRALPNTELVLCHRDFHDKQILIDGEQGVLIDLDLAAGGHPALDVGNIIAHCRLRQLKGASLDWLPIATHIANTARRERNLTNSSLRTWTASTLMRLALIYSRRFRHEGLIDALLDSTEYALDGAGEWKGVL